MDFPIAFQAPAVIAAGLVLGSFATALAHRVPIGKSWTGSERSACPHCGNVLHTQDLVPLFSWLLLKGKCRYCGHKTSTVYPLTELASAASCFGLYAAWGFTLPLIPLILTVPFLLALFIIDVRHLILPNQLVAILAALGAVLMAIQMLAGDILNLALSHLGGALLFAGVIWLAATVTGRVLKKDALGFGDVKFMAAAGLWLGASYLPFMLICAGIAGVVCGLFYRIIFKNPVFPFGPSLIISLYVSFILKGMGIIPFLAGY